MPRSTPLNCVKCRKPVTSSDKKVQKDGAHAHAKTNPDGIKYKLGCFQEASVTVESEPTLDFTWFAGYAWQMVTCQGCGNFVGWRYEKGGDTFYGLLLNQLELG